MKRITDIKELRNIQLNILDAIHNFCINNNITYFLSSGTLIGAVRHKGFKPWDDDIDLYMPRDSYEKFKKKFYKTGKYVIFSSDSIINYPWTYAKVVDTDTKLIEHYFPNFEIGINIDIFPIDYVANNKIKRKFIYKTLNFLYSIRKGKVKTDIKDSSLKGKLGRIDLRLIPIKVKTIDRIISKIISITKNSDIVANLTESGPRNSEKFFSKNAISKSIDIHFEDRIYKTMIGFDEYLTITYGNYMQLPPVEKRQQHNVTTYSK